MKKIFGIFLFSLASLFFGQVFSQAVIKGQVRIDTSVWRSVAYLSLIPQIEQINTMSAEMILDEVPIDSQGHFSFSARFFPEKDNLFRIHLSKKTDPPATLILGGNDENYLLLIANQSSNIILIDTTPSRLLADAFLSGYSPNDRLQDISMITDYLDSIPSGSSFLKKDLIRSVVNEKLRRYADTCTNALTALMALYQSQFEKNVPENQEFYRRFLKKWKKENSSYFVEFRKKIPDSHPGRIWWILLTVGAGFIIGFFLARFLQQKDTNKYNPLKDLTQQERKIIVLLKDGRSNKEISEELSIGISTVKSHINNIYSKLEISSRKEILNMELNGITPKMKIPIDSSPE